MAPKPASMPSKGDESYEASDSRIVPVDSPDPEVRTNLWRFGRLESRFLSDEQAAAGPWAEDNWRNLFPYLIYYTQYSHFVKSATPLQRSEP